MSLSVCLCLSFRFLTLPHSFFFRRKPFQTPPQCKPQKTATETLSPRNLSTDLNSSFSRPRVKEKQIWRSWDETNNKSTKAPSVEESGSGESVNNKPIWGEAKTNHPLDRHYYEEVTILLRCTPTLSLFLWHWAACLPWHTLGFQSHH